MRWLGVDPGAARVGIAACDADELVAVAVEVIPAAAAFPAIRTIARREEVGGIVVGLPLLHDGREGSAAQAARKLGERVRRGLQLPVCYEDERWSSVEAEAPERPRGSRDRPSDDIAAAIILQRFLDRRRASATADAPAEVCAGSIKERSAR